MGNLDEALSFRPFGPEDTDLKTFEVLSRAVQEHRVVRFQYKKLGARKPECRHVQPHHLACIENVWYIFAFDIDRGAMRTFVLTRLYQPELTGKRFTRGLWPRGSERRPPSWQRATPSQRQNSSGIEMTPAIPAV